MPQANVHHNHVLQSTVSFVTPKGSRLQKPLDIGCPPEDSFITAFVDEIPSERYFTLERMTIATGDFYGRSRIPVCVGQQTTPPTKRGSDFPSGEMVHSWQLLTVIEGPHEGCFEAAHLSREFRSYSAVPHA